VSDRLLACTGSGEDQVTSSTIMVVNIAFLWSGEQYASCWQRARDRGEHGAIERLTSAFLLRLTRSVLSLHVRYHQGNLAPWRRASAAQTFQCNQETRLQNLVSRHAPDGRLHREATRRLGSYGLAHRAEILGPEVSQVNERTECWRRLRRLAGETSLIARNIKRRPLLR